MLGIGDRVRYREGDGWATGELIAVNKAEQKWIVRPIASQSYIEISMDDELFIDSVRQNPWLAEHND